MKGSKPNPPSFGLVNQKRGSPVRRGELACKQIMLPGVLTSSVGESYQHEVAVDINYSRYAGEFYEFPSRHWRIDRVIFERLLIKSLLSS